MKKSFQLLIILLLVSLGLVVAGGASVAYSGSQVTVEELNSFGDKSAAEGIQLSIPVGCFEDRLTWLVEYAPEENSEAVSEVGFSSRANDDRWRLGGPEPVEIQISVTGNDGHNRYFFEKEEKDGDFLAEWDELKAVYDTLPVNELMAEPSNYFRRVCKLRCLNDYYDYYPLFVEGIITQRDDLFGVKIGKQPGLLGGMWIIGSMKEYESNTSFQDYGYWVEAEKSEDPVKNLCRGIKYRLWPEYPQKAYVGVSVDYKNQQIWQYVCEMVKDGAWESYNESPVDKPVETHSVSEMTDTDIYYAVDLRLKPSGRPRAETFEAGYGVWRIGYRVVKEKTEMKIRFTEAEPEMIHAINPEETLLEMVLSENREELYVFTAKDGLCYMTIVDLQEKQETQRLTLMSYDPELMPSMHDVILSENVVLPVLITQKWGETSNERKMAVVATGDNGEYRLQFVIDRAADINDPAYQYQRSTYWKEATLWERDLISVAVAYQNGKLAMVYSLTNSYGNNAGGWESQRPCSFWVAVYDEDGLEYAADYRVSLGISEYELGAERDNICEIRDDVEIGISWGD